MRKLYDAIVFDEGVQIESLTYDEDRGVYIVEGIEAADKTEGSTKQVKTELTLNKILDAPNVEQTETTSEIVQTRKYQTGFADLLKITLRNGAKVPFADIVQEANRKGYKYSEATIRHRLSCVGAVDIGSNTFQLTR